MMLFNVVVYYIMLLNVVVVYYIMMLDDVVHNRLELTYFVYFSY